MTDIDCAPNLKNPSDLCKFLTTILEERCKTFEQKFTNIDLRFDNHKFRFETMDKALTKAEVELSDRIRREDFLNRIGTLEKNVTRIEVAERKVDELDKDITRVNHAVDTIKPTIYILFGTMTIFLAALEILLRLFKAG